VSAESSRGSKIPEGSESLGNGVEKLVALAQRSADVAHAERDALDTWGRQGPAVRRALAAA